MATNEAKASDGASLLKRIKITKAQKVMFGCVCGASMLIGVTAVLAIYFTKSINFSMKLLDQKDIVISSLKSSQENLKTLSGQVSSLTSNVYLESVARERDFDKDGEGSDRICEEYRNATFDTNGNLALSSDEEGKNTANSSSKELTEEQRIGMVKSCSSLRVIPDAMPITTNNGTINDITVDDVDNTTRVQLDLIMKDAGVSASKESDGNSSSVDRLGSSSSYVDSTSELEPYSMLDVSVNIEGSETDLNNFLVGIDRSIRNFDLQEASLEMPKEGGNITFNGSYYAYYVNPVNLMVKKRTVCADEKSEKCVKAGGDQSVTK